MEQKVNINPIAFRSYSQKSSNSNCLKELQCVNNYNHVEDVAVAAYVTGII